MSTRQKKNSRAKQPAKQSGHGRKTSRGVAQLPGKAITNPAALGFILPRASLARSGKAQVMTDQDSGSSERIVGCDLLNTAIQSTVSTGVLAYSNPDSVFGTAAKFNWYPLTPSTISNRLAAIEEMYQWYAIRDLKVRYIPNCGSTSAGSVALGITTDVEIYGEINAPSQQQVLEFNPALLAPVWGASMMEMKFRGTKLFECFNTSNTELNLGIQAALVMSGVGPVVATVTGQVWLDYVIDFYQQVPLLSAVDLFKTGRACSRCHQFVLQLPQRKLVQRIEQKQRTELKTRLSSRESLEGDDFVVLRAQEPSVMELRPLPVSATRGTTNLFRDEGKSPISSKRAQSFKG
jgi:hypothetical protein